MFATGTVFGAAVPGIPIVGHDFFQKFCTKIQKK
jgi:hypothetical protein